MARLVLTLELDDADLTEVNQNKLEKSLGNYFYELSRLYKMVGGSGLTFDLKGVDVCEVQGEVA
ncbi:MAG: hypothetical protein Pars93KO_19690 [Parasphingorhabdus sp.]